MVDFTISLKNTIISKNCIAFPQLFLFYVSFDKLETNSEI